MAETVIRAIITAVDRFSGPMRGIVASARTPLAAFGRLGPALAGVSTELRGLLGPVAAVAGALSAAGIARAVKGFADYGGEVADTALRLGVSTRALQEYRHAAGQSGLQTGVLEEGLGKLNKSIREVALGGAPMARETFRQLGIAWTDADGRLRTADEVLPELVQGFERIRGSGERAAVAAAVFGESGERLIPLLASGSAEFSRLRQEAQRFGLAVEADALEAGKAFGDSLVKLSGALQGIALAIGARLVPVLQPMLEGLTEWIAANRELLAARVEQMVTALAQALAAVDWAALLQGLQGFAGGLAAIADRLGPTGSLVAALGVALAPLILAVGQLGWAFLAATAAVAKWAVGMTIGPAIAAFVQGIRAGTGVIWAFNAALAANPVGLTIAGIAALGAAGYALYANWEEVTGFLGRSWEWIRSGLAELLQSVMQFASSLAELLPDWLGGSGLKASIEQRVQSIRDWAGGGTGVDERRSEAAAAAPGGRRPGNLLGAQPEQRVGGEIVVRLEGAPPGTTVESVTGSGGIAVGVDVGYQPLGA